MRYLRIHTLGFAALLVALTVIHCAPTEAQADRRRRPWTTYGSDRGRLVVACDMRSDTCSDGRKIATVRASPVPCEVAPGQWEMVPEDTGCYSVRGLESWAATTSYLSWGAELDRSPWGPSARGGTLEALADGWRVHNNPDQPNSGWFQRLAGMGDGAMWTTSYILRTMTPIPMALYAGSSQSCGVGTLDTGGQWQTLSCSREVPAPFDPAASIYPGANTTGTPYSVDAKAAWTVRGDTPGRACWGGEAPVTCAADRHTISTEGWPTEAGEISITWELAEACPSGTACFVFDGRLSGADTTSPFQIWIGSTGNVTISIYDAVFASIGQQPAPGVPITVTARRRDGVLEIYRDGTLVTAKAAGPFVWNSEVNLGRRFVDSTFRPLNGSIRSLTVRSYEEVSP